jgi:phosphoribosyl 1,2-cyclic phosphodiesterase
MGLRVAARRAYFSGRLGMSAHLSGGNVKVCLLASGSKGNAVFVETGSSRLLVDAGLSAVEILRRLDLIGVDGSTLDAILISHDHADHTKGAGTLARRLKIPLLLSYQTHKAVEKCFRKAPLTEFESGYSFTFRDLLIDPFPITHDAADPVGFRIDSPEGRIGVATDLGIATRLVNEKLQQCRILVLEANHDEEMLLNGPYPWHLKQRIKSRHGHLSNTESMELLENLLHPGLEGIFLAHLSEVNNDPRLPFAAATSLLARQSRCAPALLVGDQYQPTTVFVGNG